MFGKGMNGKVKNFSEIFLCLLSIFFASCFCNSEWIID